LKILLLCQTENNRRKISRFPYSKHHHYTQTPPNTPNPFPPPLPLFTPTTSQPSNASKQRLTQNPQLPSKLSNHRNPNPTTSQPQKTPSHLPHTHQRLWFSFAPRFRKRKKEKSCGLTKEGKSKEAKKPLHQGCRKKPRFPTPVNPASPPKRKVGGTSTSQPTPSRVGECVSCQVGETEGVVGKRGRGVSLFGWGGRR